MLQSRHWQMLCTQLNSQQRTGKLSNSIGIVRVILVTYRELFNEVFNYISIFLVDKIGGQIMCIRGSVDSCTVS